jgi:hypothetical protein
MIAGAVNFVISKPSLLCFSFYSQWNLYSLDFEWPIASSILFVPIFQNFSLRSLEIIWALQEFVLLGLIADFHAAVRACNICSHLVVYC